MKKHFKFIWPIFNVIGIIVVLWSLTILNVNPSYSNKPEALLDSTSSEVTYANYKTLNFQSQHAHNTYYPLHNKNSKLVINF